MRRPGMMSEWTEYRSGDEWSQDENLEWQKNVDGVWKEAPEPAIAWSSGHRIRYREREDEMVKVSFSDDGSICYIGKVIDRWMFLAAPIAAYYKDMRYMACSSYGEVLVAEDMPIIQDRWRAKHGQIIATISKKAMPDDWKTAIVELVFEGAEE
jgi:hypothetical protein